MVSPLEHDYIGPASSSSSNEEEVELGDLKGTELRLGLPGSESPDGKNAVRLNLGMPRSSVSRAKRGFLDTVNGPGSWGIAGGGGSRGEFGKGGEPAGDDKKTEVSSSAPAAKAQVVGWPPIRSYRRNTMAANPSKNKDDAAFGCLFVKVSMDGAPYLRKVDLKTYCNYKDLSLALEKMFSCFSIGQCTSQGMPGKDGLSQSHLVDLLHGSEYVLTYEDKDGDWMLVGDVPWDMFTNSCRRLRIMSGSEAIGLAAPRAMEMQASERHWKPKDETCMKCLQASS